MDFAQYLLALAELLGTRKFNNRNLNVLNGQE